MALRKRHAASPAFAALAALTFFIAGCSSGPATTSDEHDVQGFTEPQSTATTAPTQERSAPATRAATSTAAATPNNEVARSAVAATQAPQGIAATSVPTTAPVPPTSTQAPAPTATAAPPTAVPPTAVPPTAAPPTATPGPQCDPNYKGACVPPYPPDVNCADIPVKRFQRVGNDPHKLDTDDDGIACES